ncbi:MAG TPA: peptidyl-prolyl cis-trans isomerase [Bacillales bacterium]|nr:peptidyl-prolyl cis-trans isomerase [Bacillales bacterium]
MPDIIFIKGNVDYTITLDPGAWLFDDRKFNLDDYFRKPHKLGEPPKAYKKRDLMQEEGLSLAVPLKPYLDNAAPKADAADVIIETANGENHELSLAEAENGILAFTKDGTFLNDDGPAHFYHGDGSNQDHPIKQIKQLIVR